MKKTLKWSLVMVLAVVGLTFASCSDDDDETPVVPTVEDVNGEFAGKMTYKKETAADAEETDPTATELDLIVANDSITFEKFPYGVLVKAIVGEEAAAGIIDLVGELKYQVNYTAAMNAANDSIVITLKPEPLKIEGVNVEVVIEGEETATYSIKEKNLKFNLKAKSVKFLGEEFPWEPIDLSFDMTKKK